MSADDCAKIIGAVVAAQAVSLAALARVYLAVRRNAEHIDAVAAAVGPGATMGGDRT